jgi:AraC-like DNA-binding protein
MLRDDLLHRVLSLPAVAGLDNAAAPLGGGLYAYRARRVQVPEQRLYEPALSLVLQGKKSVIAGARQIELGSGQSLLIGIDLAVTSRVTEAPYLALAVLPDPALLREIAAASGPLPPQHLPEYPQPPVSVLPSDARLIEAMGRLLSYLDSPRSLAALGPQTLREIHFWMLEGPFGALLLDLARIDGPAQRIARSIATIRQDPSRPIRVADLARAAGLSPSAFHAHFRSVTATTPLQFQKRLRLIDARARLQAGAAVSEAAFAAGYESPTQFAREYRRSFGTAPRATKAAARPPSSAPRPDRSFPS